MSVIGEPPPAARAPLLDRGWILRAVLESLLIVFSVLVALGVDEWRAERETGQRVEQARAALVQEIRANRERLLQPHLMPYHRALHARLNTLMAEQAPDGADFERAFTGFTGVHPFIGQDAVWESVNSGDVAQHLPREELLLLSAIYSGQEALDELHFGVRAALIQPSVDFREPMYMLSQAEMMRSYLGDAIPAQQELLGLYDRALARLDPSKEARK
ncbi:MAG TPA: hypothetical protein VF699_13420 [Caulobacteraceae bacterium]|jgi:hypothetical protein